jgi:TolB protein
MVVLPTATPTITLPQPTPYPVTVSPISPTRRIAFIRTVDGNQEIFTIQMNGANLEQLTTDPADDRFPIWSPDGRQIAFVSFRNNNEDIYVMNADGTALTRLTSHPGWDRGHLWSPDGQIIVFQSNRDGQPDLYAIVVQTQDITRLTNSEQVEFARQWSPDGTALLVSEQETGTTLLISRDGRTVQPLVQKSNVSWSPDGTQIAFTAFDEHTHSRPVSVMNVDGTERRAVTLTPHMRDSSPAWSPDGTQLVFGRKDGRINHFADNGLYLINADGTQRRRLVYLQTGGVKATWSPDGAFLLYVLDGGPGTMGVYPKPPDTIYVVDRDGGEPRAITQGWGATWQP